MKKLLSIIMAVIMFCSIFVFSVNAVCKMNYNEIFQSHIHTIWWFVPRTMGEQSFDIEDIKFYTKRQLNLDDYGVGEKQTHGTPGTDDYWEWYNEYAIPADVFEEEALKHFVIDDVSILRERNYDPAYNAETNTYNTYDGGFGDSMGYQVLGYSCEDDVYTVYGYTVERAYEKPDDAVEGVDYIMSNGYPAEICGAIKVTLAYNGECIKFYSWENIELSDIPNKSGLVTVDSDHETTPWITDTVATVYSAGSKYKVCNKCAEIVETATIPQLKCATPKLSKVSNTTSGVKVTWEKVDGADSYRVYRRAGGVYTWSYIGTTTATSFTDSKATDNKYWIYTVIAVNEAGYSGFDKIGKTIKCVTAPKVTSVSNTASGLYVKWNAVAGAKEYRVYRKGLNYNTWMYLGTTKNLYYTDTPIKNANGYYYKYTVIAVNDYYSGYYEDCAFTKRLSNPVLKSAVSSKAGITVKWNSVYGSTGYYVYRKTANSGWTLVGSTKGTNNATYVDKTAKKGVTYTYTVRAYYGKTLSSYNSGISCKDKY